LRSTPNDKVKGQKMEGEAIRKMKTGLLDEAISLVLEGENNQAIEKINIFKETQVNVIPLLITWVNELLGIIAEELGEEHVFEYWRKFANERFDANNSLTAYERLQFYVDAHNVLGSGIKQVEEKEDCYVLMLDPCGTMGRARRNKLIDLKKDVTKKTYDILWGKKGVPYYCIHCAMGGEIVPVEKNGKAFWLQEWPEKSDGVCCYKFLK
jgi:hypothetical protein